MLEVVITKYPQGDRSRPEPMGKAIIANDETGTEKSGNYNIEIYTWRDKPRVWKRGRIWRFDRLKHGPWHLLMLLLGASLIDDMKKDKGR